jgi:hypothetical protein
MPPRGLPHVLPRARRRAVRLVFPATARAVPRAAERFIVARCFPVFLAVSLPKDRILRSFAFLQAEMASPICFLCVLWNEAAGAYENALGMVKNEGIFQHIVILDYIFERNLENYFKPHLSSTNLLQFRDAQERRFYASAVNRLADLNYKSYARSRIILSLVGQSQDITAHGGCLNSCEYSIHDRSPIAAIHETKVNMRTDLSLLWLAQLKGANVNNWTIGYTKAFFGNTGGFVGRFGRLFSNADLSYAGSPQFVSGFPQSCGGAPQSKSEKRDKCSRNGGNCIASIVRESKETIGLDPRVHDENAEDFGRVLFGGLLGLLALLFGYAFLKRR